MKLLLPLTLFLLTSSLFADSCKTMLQILTDDDIYPGHGEVQICTNGQNQLTKLIVIKPVHNPSAPDANSSQPDERNPVIQITLGQLNTSQSDIPIMNPSRMGITVTAAYLEVPASPINKDNGGEVVLKVLKNKLLGTYHYFRLRLVKSASEWKGYLIGQNQKTPLSHAYFHSGLSGIKKVDFY